MAIKSISKLRDFIEKNKFSGIVVAILSFVVVFLFSLTTFYDQIEYKLYDWRFKLKPSVEEWDSLAFLNIDEPSINNVGEYPWPRNIYAMGLDVIKDAGVLQNAFDFEFLDKSASRVNIDKLNELYTKIDRRGRIRKKDLTNLILDNDKILAASIANFGNVILPFHFKEDIKDNTDISEEYQSELDAAFEIFYKKASIKAPDDKKDIYSIFEDNQKIDIGVPLPELIRSAHGFGYTNRDPDIDGVERKIRLIRVYKGRIYFQMGLAMLMDICGVKKENVLIEPGTSIVLKDAFNPITHEQNDISIPIDEEGMIYINWAGPGRLEDSFQHISFYALLEYPLVKDEIHDYYDDQDKEIGKWKLSKLYGELDKTRIEYARLKGLSVKRKKWEQIKEIRKEIKIVEKSYAQPIVNEIERVKRELKKGDNAELQGVLIDLNNYKKGIDIVTQVESLQDKMTIVGMTATGTQDLGVIPIHHEYMMVGTYHNVVNTILNDSFILKVNKVINIAIMFILAISIGIIVQHLAARQSLLVIVFSFIVVILINLYLFVYHNIWIELLGSNAAILLPSIIISGIKLASEETQKRYIKSAFSRYISPGVIDQIIESPEALELGGEERNITIFFSDVAKFSAISEKLSPSQLVSLLNEYLSEMTDIILSYDGTVDKYEGDAIMAFFGAPKSFEDHALKCCLASIDMKKRLREMQDNWRSLNMDVLHVRMGMNSGKAVVGNMGSKTRMDYTAMGDAVNLASRLEGANKYYSTYAMCSGATYEQVKEDIEVRKLDTIRVIGKEEPIVIYELLGRKGNLPDKMYDMLDKYYKALDSFSKREWKKAISYFNEALSIIEDDGPSITYIDRCEKYIKRPPSKKWDGVYKLTSK